MKLGLSHIVLDGTQLPKGGGHSSPLLFSPYVVAKWLDE